MRFVIYRVIKKNCGKTHIGWNANVIMKLERDANVRPTVRGTG